MRISRLLAIFLAILLVGCQIPRTPLPTSTIVQQVSPVATQPQAATQPEADTRTPTLPAASPTAAAPAHTSTPAAAPATATSAAPAGEPINFTTHAGQPLAAVELKTYQPGSYPVKLDSLPVDLGGLGNPGVIGGLSAEQQKFLSQNGFVVIPTGDKQFKDIRASVSNVYGQPYYLTVDAAYHALHITFNDTLEALEREYLRPILMNLVQAASQKVAEYAAALKGQPAAEDAQLAQAYLAVAQKLLYPDQSLDPAMEAKIAPQIAQIMSYSGKAQSALIPGFEDDYGAYRPVGHYAGKPELENYFRAMTWFGRVPFQFQSPNAKPSRAPLLITLALREATLGGLPAYQVWASMYDITDFMVGPSDDPGPAELNALMEKVYGPAPTLAGIADEGQWKTFLSRVGELPAPQINSTFATSSAAQSAERDWRFMGQRYTPDGFIFQNLIFDKVGTQAQPRKFPSGLDVAAAFGSHSAQQALEAAGETKYARYPEQMVMVQKLISGQPEAQWLNRFYTAWLYAFRPQAAQKGDAFPPYMRTAAWGYKDVNAFLGSWAELKHDTVLYAKMPEGLGGGGPPMSGPAPAYVEPNPDVFYRLAYAAAALYTGLNPTVEDWLNRGWQELPPDAGPFQFGLSSHMTQLNNLADSLTKFGDIAVKELQGQPLTSADYEVIQVCLEEKECLDHGMYSQDAPKPDPIPVVAAVSGWQNDVLEAGVGELNRIFVAVPLEGKLEIAQGGVFSYYEFTQPRSSRLTDQDWRNKLAAGAPKIAAWSNAFLVPGGKPVDVLAFRVGDVYYVTEQGGTPPLNLRAEPSKSARVLSKLEKETYLTIVDGPVKNSDGTWWKVQADIGDANVGWVLENPEWYARSHP